MLRESMLVVPNRDNAGRDLAPLRDAIALDLVHDFGGCTAHDATGHWVAPDGTLYSEPVTELIAAYEPNEANDSKLRKLAMQIGHDGKQIAVYARYADGNVEIVDTSK